VIILAQTVVFTVNGRLGDIFGRRYFFLGGAAFSTIGYIISGTANSLSQIIAGVSFSDEDPFTV
jgi:MFS family permease